MCVVDVCHAKPLLPAVAEAIRAFVDALLLGHTGRDARRLPLNMLGACFGDRSGSHEELQICPSTSRSHPEGTLCRLGLVGWTIHFDSAAGPLALILPPHFDAMYKGVICDDRAAIRLAFSARAEDGPVLLIADVPFPLVTALIDVEEVDLIYAPRGIVELKVVI